MIITRKTIEVPAGTPRCCPDLAPAATDQFHELQPDLKKVPSDGSPSMNVDAPTVVDDFPTSSTLSLFTGDMANLADMDFCPSLDDLPSSVLSFDLLDYESAISSAEVRAPPLFDFSNPNDGEMGQIPFSSHETEMGECSNFPSVSDVPPASTGSDSWPSSPHDPTESYLGPNQTAIGRRGSIIPEANLPGNGRITITLDGAERETVMEVMSILVQSKAKVRFEAA